MQGSPNSAASPEEPEKKKRKLVDTVKSTALSMITSSPNTNEDDDGSYPFGKKVKNTGTGYAGSVREDVSITLILYSSTNNSLADVRPVRSSSIPESQGPEFVRALSRRA